MLQSFKGKTKGPLKTRKEKTGRQGNKFSANAFGMALKTGLEIYPACPLGCEFFEQFQH